MTEQTEKQTDKKNILARVALRLTPLIISERPRYPQKIAAWDFRKRNPNNSKATHNYGLKRFRWRLTPGLGQFAAGAALALREFAQKTPKYDRAYYVVSKLHRI